MRLRRQRVLPGASAVDPPLTKDDFARLVLPTRRVGPVSDANGRDDLPAFVGHIDEPGGSQVMGRGLPLLRVRGWVASTRGRPVRATVRAGRAEPVVVMCELPRPDVLQNLANRFGDLPEACGFQIDVDLPTVTRGDESLSLVLEVDDGEFGTKRTFRIKMKGGSVAPRADYKATWEAAAVDVDSAKLAVSGYTSEAEYERTALQNVENFKATVGIDADDEILEIGCGVGRVGTALAPLCKRWIGADVSSNMLEHARDRLRSYDNVELVELNGWDLAPIDSESLDLVYSTVVFMHLDEWERHRYIAEAFRALRPGGRLYVDNFNLCSDPGWAFFTEMATNYHPLGRPPNISKSSTPDEMRTYFERAGFESIVVAASPEILWMSVHGRKPA
jgi:ubiquinone/menaquinone biosynthesis C-methylase UbiE